MNKATKSVARILKDNICTCFNLLNVMIAAALAYVGAWKNLLFIVIILINTAVGIFQEIKAKRQIERLTLLAQPSVAVMRDGWKINVRPGDIKQGDTLSLCAGNTVCTPDDAFFLFQKIYHHFYCAEYYRNAVYKP